MTKLKYLEQMLEGYDSPAILVTKNYDIIATNKNYTEQFGDIDMTAKPKCYAVSHGYTKPCDQAGEDCPLHLATESGQKEKVLHIHQTSNGREHVDVEMVPIFDDNNTLIFFIELLKPIPLASGVNTTTKMVGSSPALKTLLRTATRVAKTDADVLLQGESGTGKELISHLIHLSSKRSKKTIVTLECSGLSETLIESELFGHQKGAFTGAHNEKIGLVERANNGTLFLDEIGDVSLETQVKLLRLIESRTFRRVGSTQVRTSDFRLICATHRDLKQMVADGEFRLDLYYRINVFPIQVPSLAERLEDIHDLAEHIVEASGNHHHITASAIDTLSRHPFVGNIRELRNIITRAMILCDTNVINGDVIQEALALGNKTPRTALSSHSPLLTTAKTTLEATTLKEFEQAYWQHLLSKHEGNKEKIAAEAGISLRTLYRKLDGL